MSAFACTVVSCTARYAKSTTFSGWPIANERVAALVTGVGGRRRVAFLQRGGHRRIADHARPPAVADRLELSVPVLDRQPHFHLDLRVGRRLENRRDPAVRGQHGRRGRPPCPRPPAGAPRPPLRLARVQLRDLPEGLAVRGA